MSKKAADSRSIVITAAGAVTCVGLDAPQTCASLRAGINRVAEYPAYECLPAAAAPAEAEPDAEVFVAGVVPGLEADVCGRDRLLALAESALAEAQSNGGLNADDLNKCALMLALPAEDEAIATMQLSQKFIPELLERTGLKTCRLADSRPGPTGFCELIPRAVEVLRDGTAEYCLIGGVDSWLIPERLKLMDEAWRLHSDRGVDGFIPGEAAVFLLLERGDRAAARQKDACAVLGNTGFGTEQNTITDEENSSGSGLADAIAAVGGKSQKHPWTRVFCDLNGESYRSFEWGMVTVKLATAFGESIDLAHPADCVGDIGAASGPLAAAWFCESVRRGYGRHDQALVWNSADNGKRAALGLHRPEDGS